MEPNHNIPDKFFRSILVMASVMIGYNSKSRSYTLKRQSDVEDYKDTIIEDETHWLVFRGCAKTLVFEKSEILVPFLCKKHYAINI